MQMWLKIIILCWLSIQIVFSESIEKQSIDSIQKENEFLDDNIKDLRDKRELVSNILKTASY